MLKVIASFFPIILVMAGCGALDFSPLEQLQRSSTVIFAPEVMTRRTEAVPNSYIAVFKTSPGSNRLAFPSYYSEYKFHYNLLAERHLSDPRLKDIQFLSVLDLAEPQRDATKLELMMPRALTLQWGMNDRQPLVGAMARVDFTDRASGLSLLKEWDQKDLLWFAEPNWISRLSGVDDESNEYGLQNGNDSTDTPTPPAANNSTFKGITDTYTADRSPWLKPMRIAEGFKFISDQIAAGTIQESALADNAPVIAVMDSGVDYLHPALKDQMWINDGEGQADCPGDTNGCDTTVNVKGWLGDGNSIHPFGTSGAGEDCPPEGSKIAGNCRHGTHVAGIVAGKISQGVPGICPFCKIMVIKVVSGKDSAGGGIPDSALLNGMRYVTLFVRGGTKIVRIVNASLGKFQRARAVTLLVSQLYNSGAGTLLIGAAGNEDTNSRQYPAANVDAIAVASVSAETASLGAKASYSNFGPWVDIAAPGGTDRFRTDSSVPGKGTEGLVGTSMASPMVAGVAGMLLAVDPTISAPALRSILLETADQSIYQNETNEQSYYPVVAGEAARIPLLGAGTVDLMAALNRESQGLAIEAYLNSRVSAGCSTLGLGQNQNNRSAAALLMFLALMLPIFGLLRTEVRR